VKALIFPSFDTDRLAPLTQWLPEFMLPVVNKPLAEHWVELLVRHHVTDIIFILKHLPYETEQYFGDGARWGAHISYSLLGNFSGLMSAVKRIGARVGGELICLPGNLLADLDVARFLEFHQTAGSDITLARPVTGESVTADCHVKEFIELIESWPTIINPTGMNCLLGAGTTAAVGDGQFHSLPCKTGCWHVPFNFERISTPEDVLRSNRRVLAGEFPGLIIPGNEQQPGIWLGRHSRIHPGVTLHSPVLIGHQCSIDSDARLGEYAVVGNQVMVDCGATIRESVILNHTYVGANTDIIGAIVMRNNLHKVSDAMTVCLADDLILGDLEKDTLFKKTERVLNASIAVLLSLLFSPLLLMLYLYHRLFPKKLYLSVENRRGQFYAADLTCERAAREFELLFFRSRHQFLAKLPGLLNVIKGDLNLVGISPLTEEQYQTISREWEPMRSNAPAGLFRLWELEPSPDELEWEEKMVIESYYAATRSLPGDLKILMKSLSPFRMFQ
jgi:NDP-sugar pyrophosphorylase family protein